MATDIMRLLGNVPRNALERIFQALGGLSEKQYEHKPGTIPESLYPDAEGQADNSLPPRQGPEQRTGRLSGFGRFTKQILPEIVRGAVVGVSNPVAGSTADNIFGTMRNVEGDRQDRQARGQQQAAQQFQWHRQARKDAEDSQLQGAQMRNYDAQARERDARAKALGTTKAGKPTQNEVFQGFLKQMMDAKDESGEPLYTAEEAQNRAAALTNKSTHLWLEVTPRTAAAGLERDTRLLNEGKLTKKEFDERQAERKKEIGGQSEASTGGSARGRWANTPIQSKTLATPDGIANYFPGRMNATGTVTTQPKVEQTGVKLPERKAAPQRPRQLGPADAKLATEQKENSIANAALNEAGGDAPKAIQILNQRARTDKEVADNLVGATRRLQSMVPRPGTIVTPEMLAPFLGGAPQGGRPAPGKNPFAK